MTPKDVSEFLAKRLPHSEVSAFHCNSVIMISVPDLMALVDEATTRRRYTGKPLVVTDENIFVVRDFLRQLSKL